MLVDGNFFSRIKKNALRFTQSNIVMAQGVFGYLIHAKSQLYNF